MSRPLRCEFCGSADDLLVVTPEGMRDGIPMCAGCRSRATLPGMGLLRVVPHGPEDEEIAAIMQGGFELIHEALVAAIERAEAQRLPIPRPEVMW